MVISRRDNDVEPSNSVLPVGTSRKRHNSGMHGLRDTSESTHGDLTASGHEPVNHDALRASTIAEGGVNDLRGPSSVCGRELSVLACGATQCIAPTEPSLCVARLSSHRDGEHTDARVWKRVNTVPCCARVSRFGVIGGLSPELTILA